MSNYLHISGTISWDHSPRPRWPHLLVRLGAVVGVLFTCWALYSLMSGKLAVSNTTNSRVAGIR
jgi:hypothetical protein